MIVSVEGNIGAGKSTALSELEKRGYVVVREPVESWKFLARRYSDPHRWAFTFQVEALLSFVNIPSDGIVFVERSVESALLFSKIAHKRNIISDDEMALLDKIAAMIKRPTVTICIATPPETCLQRIHTRNRNAEAISIDYLRHIDKYHMDNTSWTFVDGLGSPSKVADAIIRSLS